MRSGMIGGLCAVLGVAAAAAGQQQGHITSFEWGYTASPAGVALTSQFGGGQDGWYNPVGGSVDYEVFTYTGNAYAFGPTLTGLANFAAGRSAGAGGPALAEHVVGFTNQEWKASWNVAVQFDGVLPAAPDVGSFSLEPSSGASTWRATYNWTDAATAASWGCAFSVYDAAGASISRVPGPAWEGLTPNAWYRMTVLWSFTTNKIASVSITNLATGATSTTEPTDWYLGGGAGPALPTPTAYRLSSGGAEGNIVAWDNLLIASERACYPDCNSSITLTIADFACYRNEFVAGQPYADCDGNGALLISDWGCFQTRFVQGCP